jgi:hypothetical protein
VPTDREILRSVEREPGSRADAAWERLRRLFDTPIPLLTGLKSAHGTGLVDVNEGVELPGKNGVVVAAHPLRLGVVDDADRPTPER